MKKVKVPVLSFKHFASLEANSRTMLCNISFSRVSFFFFLLFGQSSRMHSLVSQHKQDHQGWIYHSWLWIIKVPTSNWNSLWIRVYQDIIEFLWIMKVHTSIWNDLWTTRGFGIIKFLWIINDNNSIWKYFWIRSNRKKIPTRLTRPSRPTQPIRLTRPTKPTRPKRPTRTARLKRPTNQRSSEHILNTYVSKWEDPENTKNI